MRWNPLAVAGAVVLVIGLVVALAAIGPEHVVVEGGIGVVAISVILTIASLHLIWRHGGEAMGALCVSWLATAPGVVLGWHLINRGNSPFETLPHGMSLLWIFVGPCLFFVSARISPLRFSPTELNIVRAAHLAAWVTSSFLAMLCAVSV